jgi:hypothetical protein
LTGIGVALRVRNLRLHCLSGLLLGAQLFILALGLAAARNAPIPDTTFGVFRM